MRHCAGSSTSRGPTRYTSRTGPATDMALRTSRRQVDFYAPGVGVVRTEIYGKNGKLEQVTELVARSTMPQEPQVSPRRKGKKL